MRIHGLAPILPQHARILILGSMPSAASLASQQYYAHPRNAFWHIMLTLLKTPTNPFPCYQTRRELLLTHGIAVWDVYRSCERRGSLDSNIVRASAEPNDLKALLATQPTLHTIATNGGLAKQAYRRHWRDIPLPLLHLPSTSPANARQTIEEKLSAWSALQPLNSTPKKREHMECSGT
ncbi:MAG: DNA-deoxyinosine glycosylase [Proteobacteria bacterium]|nr:DNA-deoxyinosine glycosylase [Pseudomonadota bacterium]